MFKSESRLVLVDAVVTDKKGNYVRDLTAHDFHVWEDDKEQSIASFSTGEAAPSISRRQYMVLFFDNGSMLMTDQMRARHAAAQFIDVNAGPNELIGIAEFGGSTLRVLQNFTTNVNRLKSIVNQLDPSGAPSPEMASLDSPHLSSSWNEFRNQSGILALTALAHGLSNVPGRKTLVLLTAGFSADSSLVSDLNILIAACNRANIAIYPVDVRGLQASIPSSFSGVGLRAAFGFGATPVQRQSNGPFRPVSFSQPSSTSPAAAGGQHGGGSGGGTGGGGKPGGGTGSGSGKPAGPTTTTTTPNNTQPRTWPGFMPHIPSGRLGRSDVLQMIAQGTGGFVIHDTNGLLDGMEKIAEEQTKYYLLGYTPAEFPEGTCHTLKVKVDRPGTAVRARAGYCSTKPRDLLAGKPAEQELEARAASSQPAAITASLMAPFFYTGTNMARVELVMEIPTDSIRFEKAKGKLHASIDMLGLANKPDGTLTARFSDTVNLDFKDQPELDAFKASPTFHYENQFDINCGQYKLKVVFSSGGKAFGSAETPLAIDAYDGKQFTISAVSLSNDVHPVAKTALGLDQALLQDRKLLVSQGMELTPSGANRFRMGETAGLYIEIYDSSLTEANHPAVTLQYRIVDLKSGEQKFNSGPMDMAELVQKGNPVIPVAVRLPLGSIPAGTYRLDVQARDETAGLSPVRSTGLEIVSKN